MSQWTDYGELSESAAGTPLKPRNPALDNLQHNDKKRAPTTPLTPTLIDRNIVKKQYVSGTSQEGSPKSKERVSQPQLHAQQPANLTPRLSAGIKQAVKDHKKSRLQILRQSEPVADTSVSESEYSEVSTIAGDTPNYKMKENLVYYKNGYYLDNVDDSYLETERESIINEKELSRVSDVLDFMKLERKFEKE